MEGVHGAGGVCRAGGVRSAGGVKGGRKQDGRWEFETGGKQKK